MAGKQKPRRHPLGYFDAQDKVFQLNSLYRVGGLQADTIRAASRMTHRGLDDVATPEPDAELEDSELADNERLQAMARERTRREGRA